MTKEEIRQKAVGNAKGYEVWPPAADYQDGLIKGFEDGAEWMQAQVKEWLKKNGRGPMMGSLNRFLDNKVDESK